MQCTKIISFMQTDFHSLVKDRVDEAVVGQAIKIKMDLSIDKMLSRSYRDSKVISTYVLDYVWEQLNQGNWKDVHLSWRYAYTIMSLVKTLSEYSLLIEGDEIVTIAEVMKTCDMGLLMGAPICDNILARLCSAMHEDYKGRSKCSHEKGAEVVHGEQLNTYKDPTRPITISNIGNSACTPLSMGTQSTVTVDTLDHSTKEQAEVCNDNLVQGIDVTKMIKRVTCPSLERFQKDFMFTQTPIIITDTMAFWPALSSRQWTLEYIKSVAGCRTVPIEIGSKYTDDSWSQKLMTVTEFIEKHIESKFGSSNIGYLAQHQLFDQIPELQNDIIIPDYCYLGNSEDVDINAWFGPSGTVSPLHFDPKHNFLAQVIGEKYIRIYPVSESNKLYSHVDTLLNNTSCIDVENPDFKRFPLLKTADYVECVLKSGEMLYMPPRFWHFVKSLSLSFSVSFWWD